jgi:hypothetical protein
LDRSEWKRSEKEEREVKRSKERKMEEKKN